MASITTRQRIAQLQRTRVPRVLWKYGTARAIGILEALELKVTRPNEFNDPFEWAPGIVGAVTASDVEGLYADPEWVAHWTPPALDETDPADRAETLTALGEILTETGREIMEEELDRISADRGFVCLTADPNSILMWSHYADNHRGLAIGIDHRKLGTLPLFPVTYGRRRVLFNALTPLRVKPNVRTMEIFLRKSPVWAYEREYRMVWPFAETLPRRWGEMDVNVIPLLPEAIAEVRLGARASKELEESVRATLQTINSGARITRGHLHPRAYRLEFRDVD